MPLPRSAPPPVKPYDVELHYTPLSVRHGGRRKRLAWWVLGLREALAYRLAPWLRGPR